MPDNPFPMMPSPSPWFGWIGRTIHAFSKMTPTQVIQASFGVVFVGMCIFFVVILLYMLDDRKKWLVEHAQDREQRREEMKDHHENVQSILAEMRTDRTAVLAKMSMLDTLLRQSESLYKIIIDKLIPAFDALRKRVEDCYLVQAYRLCCSGLHSHPPTNTNGPGTGQPAIPSARSP